MKALPIKPLSAFFCHYIYDCGDIAYYLFMDVSGFILAVKEDKIDGTILYANGGTDFDWAKEHYEDLNYTTINEIYK